MMTAVKSPWRLVAILFVLHGGLAVPAMAAQVSISHEDRLKEIRQEIIENVRERENYENVQYLVDEIAKFKKAHLVQMEEQIDEIESTIFDYIEIKQYPGQDSDKEYYEVVRENLERKFNEIKALIKHGKEEDGTKCSTLKVKVVIGLRWKNNKWINYKPSGEYDIIEYKGCFDSKKESKYEKGKLTLYFKSEDEDDVDGIIFSKDHKNEVMKKYKEKKGEWLFLQTE